MQQRDIEIVREEVRQTVSYLRAQFPDLEDDERAWIDTLEGETQRFLREIEDTLTTVEEQQDAAKEVINRDAA